MSPRPIVPRSVPPIVDELQAIFNSLPDETLRIRLKRKARRGRPGYDSEVLWHCYIAYYALGLESVSALVRKDRTAIERLNSRLKAFYRLNAVRVRGRYKVILHALLSVIVLQARAVAFSEQPRCCVQAAA